jgi:hypothetical protein
VGYPSRVAALQRSGPAVGVTARRGFDAGAGADPRQRLEPEFLRVPYARSEPWHSAPQSARRGRRSGRRKEAGERVWLLASALLIMACGICFLAVLQREFGPRFIEAPPLALPQVGDDDATGSIGSLLDLAEVSGARTGPVVARRNVVAAGPVGGDTPAAMVARAWSALAPDGGPPTRYAALETAPRREPVHPRVPSLSEAKTALIDFETSPFPYEGKMPSGKAFFDVVEGGRRGHRTSSGHVYWEDETYSDRRVLLHIPPQFDVNQPGVIIVFFHGNGATLGRDVRDRQQVPAQITNSGINAVLVAPQFAVDAADSSAGRFWEPGAFDRFVGEASEQLARLYGDRFTARNFAKMPMVIVAYSGGYLPTLSSIGKDKDGVRSRLRGVVLLDALYSGLDKFASWIAQNRSGFFVSAYTHYTRGHNADLERMLSERAVAYSTELRDRPLAGSVTFLATGSDVRHRDFVTHAWVDNPIKDLLGRLAEYDTRTETADASARSGTVAPARNRN